ncbi:MAG: DNA mismatch repair protein MutS [Pseudomonadota bacterium]
MIKEKLVKVSHAVKQQGALILCFDDAVAASEALDIALTKRGKHLGEDIPMCGVPVHSAEGYLLSLIRKGFRVAVCEQMEDPAEAKKRGSKAVVKRDVVRLVTPGTLTEESLLEARRHNFLAAFSDVRGECALAWSDISTGALHVVPLEDVRLGPELARLSPSELILADQYGSELAELVSDFDISITPLARAAFDSASAQKRLCDLFGVSTLDAFGQFSRAELSAMGALIEYVELTQKGKLPLIRPPIQEMTAQVMQIDAATRRNLELTRAMTGGKAGSLLAVLDRTVTPGGGRLLERRLSSPSRDLEKIKNRLDAVSFATEQSRIAADLRDGLRKVPDLDRAMSRLSLDRGGPRDLAAIRNGLSQAVDIASLLENYDLPQLLSEALAQLLGHESLIELLENALVAEPPLLVRDGGFVTVGYDAELDEVRQLRDEGRGMIASMQSEYAKLTGIQSLKIKHNNVLGYFVEVTATHADKMLSEPLNETFKHRQTTANQIRFTTIPLSEMETRILNAGGRAIEIEKRLYQSLKSAILDSSATISETAKALSEFDLVTAFADIAKSENWCRPKVDNSRTLNIEGGRHPVVEHAIRRESGNMFVANSCTLDDTHDIWLLTGPNMAGKSTFLRQNALIAVLAQMGCFVPATSAHIGLVSKLFSRVGASDDLARGRSTFMVEMIETATILNQADKNALVILDEIGRGTATYDGLSIAWATLEHLHEVNQCRTLFATHYHELTHLNAKLNRLENATVAVKEHDGDVVFLHEVRKGAADRSYGVQVAKLAGLPGSVIDRARVILEALEKGEREGEKRNTLVDDLPLFSAVSSAEPKPKMSSKLEDRLNEILPDDFTPREALELLYELKELSKS